MKKKDLYALACIFCLAACSDPASDEIQIVRNFIPVQFSVQLQKEILPFSPATRSMPPNAVTEPTMSDKNTGNKELKDLCSYIEYIVYNEETPSVPIKHHIYNVNDPDFSIVYDTLQAGIYQIHFLAHTSEGATFTNNIFSFDKITDTFYNKQILDLENKDARADFYVDLQRIVSRIEFKAKDKVPENIGKFELAVDHYPDQFNILTGEGIVSSLKSGFSYEFKAEEKGETGKIHSFYTFIPSVDSEKLSVTLTSTDSGGQVMRSQTVKDIHPIANKIIRYTGTLYTPPKPNEFENTFQLNVYNNGEWSETEEKELQE